MENLINNYIDDLCNFFKQTKITDLDRNEMSLADALKKAADIVIGANASGRKVMFIGNGGSAAVASHKALDYWFTGKIRGLSFSDHANLTAVSNDFGYQNVFVKQIEMFADQGDVLMAISSSGNSENIILAVEAARHRGCVIFTFSGFKETNRLRNLGDLNFYIPVHHYNKVESLHLLLCDCILEIITHQKRNNSLEREKILVAIDRDGTIIHDDGYFGKDDNWQENVKFYNGGAEGIKILNNFAKVAVVTNQIGVARGLYGPERVVEINQYLDSFLKAQGAVVDGWYFSPYVERAWAEKQGLGADNPWAVDGFPGTRKPEIGMLKLATADFGKDLSSYKKIFVIGDELDDLQMALKANGIGILLQNGKNHHVVERAKELELLYPDRIFYANNLIEAAEIIKLKSLIDPNNPILSA